MIYLNTAYDTFNHCWDCAADLQWWKDSIKWGWDHPQTQRAWTQLKTPQALGAIAGALVVSAVAYYVWSRYKTDLERNPVDPAADSAKRETKPLSIEDSGNYETVSIGSKPPEDSQGAS